MNSTRSIPVVCAILRDELGRILLAQRPPHKHLGLKWEFPGGKVETNEQPEAALVREIKEELGCDIVIGRALPRYTHDYGTVLIEMIPFECTLVAGSVGPAPHEHVAIAWEHATACGARDLAPADWPLLRHLNAEPEGDGS